MFDVSPEVLELLKAELAATKSELAGLRRDFETFMRDGKYELARVRQLDADNKRLAPLRAALAESPEAAAAYLSTVIPHQRASLLRGLHSVEDQLRVIARCEPPTRADLVTQMNLSPSQVRQIDIMTKPGIATGLYKISNGGITNTWRSPETEVTAKVAREINAAIPGLCVELRDKKWFLRAIVVGTVPRFHFTEQLDTLKEHVPGFEDALRSGALVVEAVPEAEAASLLLADVVAPRSMSKATKAKSRAELAAEAAAEREAAEAAERERWKMIGERMASDRASLVKGAK